MLSHLGKRQLRRRSPTSLPSQGDFSCTSSRVSFGGRLAQSVLEASDIRGRFCSSSMKARDPFLFKGVEKLLRLDCSLTQLQRGGFSQIEPIEELSIRAKSCT
jgi:hypothetical protein